MTPTQTLAKALETAPTQALAMKAAKELLRLEKERMDLLRAFADSVSATLSGVKAAHDVMGRYLDG
jgi:hypothetical protein